MPDAIRVSLTPDLLRLLGAGIPAKAMLTVANTSMIVDQFMLRLDGLPAEWYHLPDATRVLFPEEKDAAELVIQPPRRSPAAAGTYPFTIVALSQASRAEVGRTTGTLQVAAITALDLDLQPRRATRRKGRYTLTVHNKGNGDVDVNLDARDAEDGCRYTFAPPLLHLGANRRAAVRLTVRPHDRKHVGPEMQHDFEVTAQPSQGEAKTLTGTLVYKPRLRSWRPVRRAAALGVVAAVLAVPYNSNPVKQLACTYTAICTWLSHVKHSAGAPATGGVTTCATEPRARSGTSTGTGVTCGLAIYARTTITTIHGHGDRVAVFTGRTFCPVLSGVSACAPAGSGSSVGEE